MLNLYNFLQARKVWLIQASKGKLCNLSHSFSTTINTFRSRIRSVWNLQAQLDKTLRETLRRWHARYSYIPLAIVFTTIVFGIPCAWGSCDFSHRSFFIFVIECYLSQPFLLATPFSITSIKYCKHEMLSHFLKRFCSANFRTWTLSCFHCR